MTAADCPRCTGRWPTPEYLVADFATSTAYLHHDQFFPGWTVLVLNRHATELYQLAREERSALMEEMTELAQAVATVTGAVKMNYELLGNQVAHIHWHLIPRLPADPAPGGPVWTVTHEPRTPDTAERQARIAALRQRLGR